MSLSDARLWELKQTAKWSLDIEERKKAITDIVHDYGEDALELHSQRPVIRAHETSVIIQMRNVSSDMSR